VPAAAAAARVGGGGAGGTRSLLEENKTLSAEVAELRAELGDVGSPLAQVPHAAPPRSQRFHSDEVLDLVVRRPLSQVPHGYGSPPLPALAAAAARTIASPPVPAVCSPEALDDNGQPLDAQSPVRTAPPDSPRGALFSSPVIGGRLPAGHGVGSAAWAEDAEQAAAQQLEACGGCGRKVRPAPLCAPRCGRHGLYM
jgi:hypothetical protein